MSDSKEYSGGRSHLAVDTDPKYRSRQAVALTGMFTLLTVVHRSINYLLYYKYVV